MLVLQFSLVALGVGCGCFGEKCTGFAVHPPKPENNTLEKETKHYKPPVLGFNMLILEGVEI